MRGRTVRLTIGIAGTFMLLAAEAMALRGGAEADATLLNLAIGLAYLYGGLAIWGHDPENRTGRLMTAVGLAWVFPSLAASGMGAVAVVGDALYDTSTIILLALILAYPSGHFSTRVDRVAVAVLAVAITGLNIAQFLPPSLFINDGNNGLYVGLTLVLAMIAVILRRWIRAPVGSRRELMPVLVAGGVFTAGVTVNLVRRILDVSDVLGAALEAANELAPAAIPIALLIGFYRRSELRLQALVDAIPDRIVRIGRGGLVTDVRTRTTHGAPGIAAPAGPDMMAALASEMATAAVARALETDGLQSFDFAVTVPDGRREYEARLTASGPDEATAIIRDFTDQRTAENEMRRSRVRIVEATDATRRRLERDLHDGAQQRLVALSLSLGLLRRQLDDPEVPGRDATAAVDTAITELKVAIRELRDLARGIHPAILTEAGLGAGIESLAARSPVPTAVTGLPDRRLSPGVEATAYFVVSEALANAAKHASADHAVVAATCEGPTLRVEVSDDGVGGADPSHGTGLEGLRDRVAALGGRLTVDSAAGQGTRIVAEIPLV